MHSCLQRGFYWQLMGTDVEDHTQTLSGALGSTEEGKEILLKTEVEDTRRTRSP